MKRTDTVRTIVLTVAGTALIVGSGVVQGLQTDRWGLPSNVKTAAERLESLPETIGDWSSQERTIGERQLEQAEAVGYVSRRYTNRVDGSAAEVMILCGRPGPISVHPPTVCFTGAGWKLSDSPQRVTVGEAGSGGKDTFYVADFERRAGGARHLMRTYWAWNATGRWEAPEAPRLEFAPHGHLYKLYVMGQITDRDERNDADAASRDDAATRFLKVLLPVLEESLLWNR